MTLIGNMADYGNPPPPIMVDPPLRKEGADPLARLKKRYGVYANRQKQSLENSHNSIEAKFAASKEETNRYLEKLQQIKNKKSNKRQRDPNGGQANQQKRKLSSAKADGPPVKQPNLDKSGDDDVNDSEDLRGLLADLDIPEQFSPNNPLMNDIINMLESESSNASQQDCHDKDRKSANNNIYSNSTNSQPTQQTIQQQNNNASQQQRNNTTSPQQLPNRTMSNGNQMLDVHHAQQRQAAEHYNQQMMQRSMTGYSTGPKAEPMPVSASYAASAAASQGMNDIPPGPHAPLHHQPHMAQRQTSMPVTYDRQGSYPNGIYPGAKVPVPMPGHPSMTRMPAADYGRQISAPAGQHPGHPGYSYPQHPQMAAGRVRGDYPPTHPAAMQSSGYPGYYQPHPMATAEDIRMDHIRMNGMHKIPYSRANSLPHPYMDQRVPPTTGGYYPPPQDHPSQAAMAQQHAVAAAAAAYNRSHSMQSPSSGLMMPSNSPYMTSHPGYMPQQHPGQPMPSAAGMMPGRPMPTQQHPSTIPSQDIHGRAPQHLQQSMSHGMVPRQHPSNIPANLSAPSPHPSVAYPGNSLPAQNQIPRQNSLPPTAQGNQMMPQSMSQIPLHHMPNNRPPSSGQPQIPPNHPSMHQQHHARPPSTGNPHHSHHQQPSQYPMPPQAISMVPQIPQRVAMSSQQQRPPSQDQMMQQSVQQQNQPPSYMGSSAEDLSDLEAILSQT